MSNQQLVVDWTRCDGHGLCAELLPEVISLDDWGYPIVAHGAADAVPAKAVRRAIHTCPNVAIRIKADKPPSKRSDI